MKSPAVLVVSLWLGGRDSNPDSQIQSLESYHWTTYQHEVLNLRSCAAVCQPAPDLSSRPDLSTKLRCTVIKTMLELACATRHNGARSGASGIPEDKQRQLLFQLLIKASEQNMRGVMTEHENESSNSSHGEQDHDATPAEQDHNETTAQPDHNADAELDQVA